MLIDLVFVVLLVLAVIKGYTKGFIIAIFSLLALVAGLAAAMKCSTAVAAWLSSSVHAGARWLPFIAFLLVFLGVALLVRLGAKAIEKMVELAMLGWVNRLAGIVLYLLLYMIVLSVVLFYAEKIHLIAAQTIADSKTYPFIQPWGPKVMEFMGKIIPFFSNMFHELEAFFANVSGKIPPPGK
ncbi:MAG: CvpA family protein [Bacteroidetes bacterium]|nr:CvpA family protein [Bacteroidota bacterium]